MTLVKVSTGRERGDEVGDTSSSQTEYAGVFRALNKLSEQT